MYLAPCLPNSLTHASPHMYVSSTTQRAAPAPGPEKKNQTKLIVRVIHRRRMTERKKKDQVEKRGNMDKFIGVS